METLGPNNAAFQYINKACARPRCSCSNLHDGVLFQVKDMLPSCWDQLIFSGFSHITVEF